MTSSTWFTNTSLDFSLLDPSLQLKIAGLATTTSDFYSKYIVNDNKSALKCDLQAALLTTEEYALDLMQNIFDYFTKYYPKPQNSIDSNNNNNNNNNNDDAQAQVESVHPKSTSAQVDSSNSHSSSSSPSPSSHSSSLPSSIPFSSIPTVSPIPHSNSASSIPISSPSFPSYDTILLPQPHQQDTTDTMSKSQILAVVDQSKNETVQRFTTQLAEIKAEVSPQISSVKDEIEHLKDQFSQMSDVVRRLADSFNQLRLYVEDVARTNSASPSQSSVSASTNPLPPISDRSRPNNTTPTQIQLQPPPTNALNNNNNSLFSSPFTDIHVSTNGGYVSPNPQNQQQEEALQRQYRALQQQQQQGELQRQEEQRQLQQVQQQLQQLQQQPTTRVVPPPPPAGGGIRPTSTSTYSGVNNTAYPLTYPAESYYPTVPHSTPVSSTTAPFSVPVSSTTAPYSTSVSSTTAPYSTSVSSTTAPYSTSVSSTTSPYSTPVSSTTSPYSSLPMSAPPSSTSTFAATRWSPSAPAPPPPVSNTISSTFYNPTFYPAIPTASTAPSITASSYFPVPNSAAASPSASALSATSALPQEMKFTASLNSLSPHVVNVNGFSATWTRPEDARVFLDYIAVDQIVSVSWTVDRLNPDAILRMGFMVDTQLDEASMRKLGIDIRSDGVITYGRFWEKCNAFKTGDEIRVEVDLPHRVAFFFVNSRVLPFRLVNCPAVCKFYVCGVGMNTRVTLQSLMSVNKLSLDHANPPPWMATLDIRRQQ